jgi:hypothetical protein
MENLQFPLDPELVYLCRPMWPMPSSKKGYLRGAEGQFLPLPSPECSGFGRRSRSTCSKPELCLAAGTPQPASQLFQPRPLPPKVRVGEILRTMIFRNKSVQFSRFFSNVRVSRLFWCLDSESTKSLRKVP